MNGAQSQLHSTIPAGYEVLRGGSWSRHNSGKTSIPGGVGGGGKAPNDLEMSFRVPTHPISIVHQEHVHDRNRFKHWDTPQPSAERLVDKHALEQRWQDLLGREMQYPLAAPALGGRGLGARA